MPGRERKSVGSRYQPYKVSNRPVSLRSVEAKLKTVKLEAETMSTVQNEAGDPSLQTSEQTPQDSNSLKEKIIKLLEDRKKPLRILKAFGSEPAVTRQMLAGVQNKVALYNEIKDADVKLDYLHSEWLDCIDKTVDELEVNGDPLRPSVIKKAFDESGEIMDNVEAAFKNVKKQYGDKQAVIDFLDFIDSGINAKDIVDNKSQDGSESSIVLGKGEEYIKKKLPKLKTDIDGKFAAIKKKIDDTEDLSSNQLNQLKRQLESLVSKLEDNSPLENLIKDAYSIPSYDKKDLTEFEDWQTTTKALVESLLLSVGEKVDEKVALEKDNTVTSSKSSYNTFLKKQDPPKFSGDCLDYMEFKRKWNSQVSAHKPPEEYELDLLKSNIPEEGKKKLYGVDSIATAWVQLGKLYGDKSLICQKLKSRLKRLKSASNEPHEIVIEIHNEIEYIVKRLKDIDADSVLQFDNEYLNSCYKQLPAIFQYEWDKFDTDKFDHSWAAFENFMQTNAASALKKRTLVESLKDLGDKATKAAKGGPTVLAADIIGGSDVDSSDMNEKQAKKYQDLKKKAGNCKLCKVMHTFKSKWMKTPLPSDRFFNCPKFKNMSAKNKGETLQKHNACVRCTSWTHKRPECMVSAISCKEKIDGEVCGKDHSKLVCNSGVAYCTNLLVKTGSSGSSVTSGLAKLDEDVPTIPEIQDVTVESNDKRIVARVHWDSGSNRVLINDTFAKELELVPYPTIVIMKTAGGDRKRMNVNTYELNLVEKNGNLHRIWGYGVATIIEPEEPVDPSPLKKFFPHIPKAVFSKLEKRRIDILIGLDHNSLFPTGGTGADCHENIRVKKTRFGSRGWIIGGTHSSLSLSQKSSAGFSDAASQLMSASSLKVFEGVNVVDLSTQVEEKLDHINVAKVVIEPELTSEYWDSDNLSVLPPRRCSKCRACYEKGECSQKHLIHSLEEENELIAIRDNVTVGNGESLVSYPFKKDPNCLPFNRDTAVKVADRLWRTLKKDGLLDTYNAEIKKFLEKGTFVKLTREEMNSWAGPAQYITHHAVLKESASTPVRVVTNSSFKNGKYSLNDILPKGPNSLNDMLEVTVRFRAYEKALAFDLAKAYNTMKTGLTERHVRRLIWRFDENSPWTDFAIDKVHYGDRPAACQLECCKEEIAKAGKDIDPEASKKLIEDVYVDDGMTGGNESTIERMVGEKVNGDYTGTLSQILAIGGFKIKEFVIEGDMTQDDQNLLSNKVFGYSWDPKTKYMRLKMKFNLSRKKRSVRTLPDITAESLGALSTVKFTKRNLLGVTNSFGDFLGLADPFTIRFRLLMKNLFDKKENNSWDDEISDIEKQAWIQIIKEAVFEGEHVFPRRTRPDLAVGRPRAGGLADGAFPAFGGSVYLIWEHGCKDSCCKSVHCKGLDGGHWSAFLVLAKGRVTPLSGYTIPRSEMSSGVLVSRLLLRVVRALSSMTESIFSSIILLDSECTISTLEASASQLKPFFHNRRAEIIENMEAVSKHCEMEPVHWVPTDLNVADLLTRGTASLADIGIGSLWQTGPKFFSLPRSEWPVNRNCVNKSSIPTEEMRAPSTFAKIGAISVKCFLTKTNSTTSNFMFGIRDVLAGSNDLESRKRVIARLIQAWKSTREAVKDNLTPDLLIEAERLILTYGMTETAIALDKGQLDSLMPKRSGHLIVTTGRLGEEPLQALLGVSELPILMPKSRVAELYMWRSHVGFSGILHRSVAETLARSRSYVWIVKGKELAKKIVSSCMECRRFRKRLLGQQMADLKVESSTICPPWTHIALDFAGPILVKGEVNVRAHKKCWIIVYICRSTKAVCLLPTAGYDTESFLCRHREFVARHGRPRNIVSDRGTQLVKSGIIIAEKDSPKGWDWSSVVKQNAASSWQFVPIGAAHRNGLAESTVKILKQSLYHAIPPGVILKFSELNTLLAEISFSINCRPLGLAAVSGDSQQEDYLTPITPNQLLLGRTNDDGPVQDYVDDDRLSSRLSYVSQVFDCWWNEWIKKVLPSLVPVKRWKSKRENLDVGDVVMMHYPGPLKNDYRLAKVVAVHPDKRGLVRTVTVAYRKRDKRDTGVVYKSKPLVEEQVAVQRLSLLVPSSEQ